MHVHTHYAVNQLVAARAALGAVGQSHTGDIIVAQSCGAQFSGTTLGPGYQEEHISQQLPKQPGLAAAAKYRVCIISGLRPCAAGLR